MVKDFRDSVVLGLRQLGVNASSTDLVIDGYINLIDLGNLPNGNALFLRAYSPNSTVHLLEAKMLPDSDSQYERIQVKEYELAGLVYVLGARGVQYNPQKAYAASQVSITTGYRVKTAVSAFIRNKGANILLATALTDAFVALADNMTEAELERSIRIIEKACV